MGWISIIILGLSFGLIEECFLMQSLFNPHFLGFDFSYGRLWGTNWIWGQTIIVYHAFWSISIPILLTELIFQKQKSNPWLNGWGTGLVTVLFLFSCVAFSLLFRKMSGFSASFIHFAGSGLVAAILVTLAIKIRGGRFVFFTLKTPSTLATGIISFAACALWFIFESTVFTKGYGLPVWLIQLSIIFVAVYGTSLIAGWVKYKWNDYYRLSISWGAIMASMLFGLNNLVGAKNFLDITGQAALIIIVNILLLLLNKRMASMQI